MTNSERASYIRGLMVGLELDPETKETKVFQAMMDLLEDLSATVTELEDGLDTITEEVEGIDEALEEIGELIYQDCSCGDHHDHSHCRHDEDDEEIEFEVVCPGCKKVIEVDEEMLNLDTMTCPQCGGALEFVFDDDDDEDEAEELEGEPQA